MKASVQGVIEKGIAGFYYVNTGDTTYQAKARGLFRKKGKTPLVGDRVTIEIQEDGDAWITEIAPRRNSFIRPPVANVEVLCLVIAARKPDPIPLIIDRFLIMAEARHAEAVLVINKTDLAEPPELEALCSIYRPYYPVVPVSGKTGEGIDALRSVLRGKIAALAGPSGVGKSTIINRLTGAEIAETGSVSERLGRGKQTTRASELYALGGGTYLFDTPGFTSFSAIEAARQPDEIEDMEAELTERDLQFCFPEFAPYIGNCRFDNCLHLKEPSCAVTAALESGRIAPQRYESYRTVLEEIRARKRYS